MKHGYTGPAATILENGTAVAPGTPLEDSDLSEREREFFQGEGWLIAIEDASALTGDQLKARAAELEVEGRSSMNAEELRAAIADAEAAHAGNGA